MSDAQALFVCVCFNDDDFTPEEEQLLMELCPHVDVNHTNMVCVCVVAHSCMLFWLVSTDVVTLLVFMCG